MKQSTGCQPSVCANETLQHPRYYVRQLMTPVEMNLEHDYWRGKLRRHNRLMHGWGVVCGARLCAVPKADGSGFEPRQVRVTSGDILTPTGDEIMIGADQIVYLDRENGRATAQNPLSAMSDPWCSDIPCETRTGSVCIAVRYVEIPTRPVKIPAAGCGCDNTQCEDSRLCDGYEIGVRDHCPDSTQKGPPDLMAAVKQETDRCPECPADEWVILGCVDLEDGDIKSIHACACRRQVASFAQYWWTCAEHGIAIKNVYVDQTPVVPGKRYTLTVTGDNLQAVAEAKLGEGIMVDKPAWDQSASQLKLAIYVDGTAHEGDRNLLLIAKDCTTAFWEKALRVEAPSAVKAGAEQKPSGKVRGKK